LGLEAAQMELATEDRAFDRDLDLDPSVFDADHAAKSIGSWLSDDMHFVALQQAWRETGASHADWAHQLDGKLGSLWAESAPEAESPDGWDFAQFYAKYRVPNRAGASSTKGANNDAKETLDGVDGFASEPASMIETRALQGRVDWLIEVVRKLSSPFNASASVPNPSSQAARGKSNLDTMQIANKIISHEAPIADIAASAIVATDGSVAQAGMGTTSASSSPPPESQLSGSNNAASSGLEAAAELRASFQSQVAGSERLRAAYPWL